jgi:hypothetical protein
MRGRFPFANALKTSLGSVDALGYVCQNKCLKLLRVLLLEGLRLAGLPD